MYVFVLIQKKTKDIESNRIITVIDIKIDLKDRNLKKRHVHMHGSATHFVFDMGNVLHMPQMTSEL